MQAVGTMAAMKHVPAHVELINARPALLEFHKRLSQKVFEPGEESCWQGVWDPKKRFER